MSVSSAQAAEEFHLHVTAFEKAAVDSNQFM